MSKDLAAMEAKRVQVPIQIIPLGKVSILI